jgi:uncharacterized protein YcbX
MTAVSISQIYIYPVKSLAGIGVNRWEVTETGLKCDRKWMLIDNDGQFLSQRRLPRMALIKTALTGDKLIVVAPGMNELALDLEPKSLKTIRCTIWRDDVDAWSVSKAADQWFSAFLNTGCRLVFQPDESIRRVDQNYAQPKDITALSDGFPFLLLSENSLVALNKAMQLDLPVMRFRPNLVISGCDAYAEDYWREISIGNIGFRLPKPCSRCSVPTIDPVTAETGKEPLATLNRLRKWDNKVYFGQNALHNNCGIISVGDPATIIKTGSQQPPLFSV